VSATGLDVFDRTLQTTHTWLNEISEEVGPDRLVAWHVLGAVIRTLRDRLPLDLAAHFGAELPLLVRGTYYDQWHPAGQPEKYRTLDEFLHTVGRNLGAIRPVDARDAARAVFAVLSRHMNEGQIQKVRKAMPEDVRALWLEAEGLEADGASTDAGSAASRA
jgi:uncharacterized protein (DUF2267 family)